MPFYWVCSLLSSLQRAGLLTVRRELGENFRTYFEPMNFLGLRCFRGVLCGEKPCRALLFGFRYLPQKGC